MKKLMFIIALSIFISCNTAEDKTALADSTTASSETVTFVSPVTYSSEFEMGNNKQAQTIVAIWKDFDDNNLANNSAAFADSITIELPGMTLAGTRDSVMASTKAYRDGFTTVSSVVEAVLPTRAKNRNEDWVAIWGRETRTDKAGKTDSARIHEIWRFNKEGKIDYMAQFLQQK